MEKLISKHLKVVGYYSHTGQAYLSTWFGDAEQVILLGRIERDVMEAGPGTAFFRVDAQLDLDARLAAAREAGGILAIAFVGEASPSRDERLLKELREMQKRAPMYFGRDPKVEDLYNFLGGYRLACAGVPTVRDYFQDLRKFLISTKAIQTGSRVPDHTDVTFDEAITRLIALVEA